MNRVEIYLQKHSPGMKPEPTQTCPWVQDCVRDFTQSSNIYTISRTKSGRPRILEHEHLFVSRSHTKDQDGGFFDILAIGQNGAIGIDIEIPHRKIDVTLIAQQLFEFSFLKESSGYQVGTELFLFLRAWTRIESWIKAHDKDLFFPFSTEELFHSDSLKSDISQILSLQISNQFIMSLTLPHDSNLVFHF